MSDTGSAELSAAVAELAASGPFSREDVEQAVRALRDPDGIGVPATDTEIYACLPKVAGMAGFLGVPMATIAAAVREAATPALSGV